MQVYGNWYYFQRDIGVEKEAMNISYVPFRKETYVTKKLSLIKENVAHTRVAKLWVLDYEGSQIWPRLSCWHADVKNNMVIVFPFLLKPTTYSMSRWT